MAGALPRRTALLGAAALLGGCEAIDGIFGERQRPLPGERRSVLDPQARLAADPTLANQVVTLPAPQRIEEWPVPGGNAAHNPPPAAIAGPLSDAWRASVGSGSGYRQRVVAGPVIGGGSVFAADAFGEVSAFDLQRGARRWSRDTRPENERRGGGIGAGCAFADGTLYVGSGYAEALALDAASGEVRWRTRLPAPARGAPAVDGGRVFVPLTDNQLVAVAAEDGRRLWSYRGAAAVAVPLGLPAPAIERDVVVAGFPSGELVALRAGDGRVVWAEALGSPAGGGFAEISGIRAMPVIAGGLVYASALSGLSVAVDLRSGRRVWEREIGGGSAPAVAGDWAFFVNDEAEILAVGAEDGGVRWLTPLNPPAEGRRRVTTRWGGPMLIGDRLLVPGSAGQASWVESGGGAIAGTQRLPGAVELPAAIAGEHVVFVTEEGWVGALRGAAA